MILILFQLTMNFSTSSSISRNFGAQTRSKDDYRFTNTTILEKLKNIFKVNSVLAAMMSSDASDWVLVVTA